MKAAGVSSDSRFFLPPYEWYNDSIVSWTNDMGVELINYSPGTISHADYTTPEMKNYKSSDVIIKSIDEKSDDLNGFILLVHIGTDPRRTDKLYSRLPSLIQSLKAKKYRFVRVDTLLSAKH
jgi:peptidoglycan/xylan/chitin deacetylase (PgdA/CDA1 family)